MAIDGFSRFVEREQRPRFISSLHGLYEKPRSSRRLLNAFVLPTNRAGPKVTLARAPALNNIIGRVIIDG